MTVPVLIAIALVIGAVCAMISSPRAAFLAARNPLIATSFRDVHDSTCTYIYIHICICPRAPSYLTDGFRVLYTL